MFLGGRNVVVVLMPFKLFKELTRGRGQEIVMLHLSCWLRGVSSAARASRSAVRASEVSAEELETS